MGGRLKWGAPEMGQNRGNCPAGAGLRVDLRGSGPHMVGGMIRKRVPALFRMIALPKRCRGNLNRPAAATRTIED